MTTSDVDLHGAAALMHRSYDWLRKHWRTLDGFPPPFVGGERGGRPWWLAADIQAYKAGARWSVQGEAPVATPGDLTQRTSPISAAQAAPSNDLRPPPAPAANRAAHLLAAAGGRR